MKTSIIRYMFLANGEVLIFSPRHFSPPDNPNSRSYESMGLAKLIFTCQGLSVTCYPSSNDNPKHDYNNDELRLRNFFNITS